MMLHKYKDFYYHPELNIVTYKNWLFQFFTINGQIDVDVTVSGHSDMKPPTSEKAERICKKAFEFFSIIRKK